MANYRLTNKADADLSAHYEYGIESFGLAQAQDYFLALHDRFELLVDNPALGRNADDLTIGLQRFEYGEHVIFYLEEDRGILIVRVLRQEADFSRHL